MTDQAGLGIPPSLAAAWGVTERPHKGPKRELSLAAIVAAGVRLADAQGLGAVSMSGVAAELGVSAMGLYRYVGAKDELLELMVDHAYGPPPPPLGPGENWRDGLGRWGWSELGQYRLHPWALMVPISGPPRAPNSVRWLETGLDYLSKTELSPGEKMSVILLVSNYTRSAATITVQVEAAFLAPAPSGDEAMLSYTKLLRELTDPGQFPGITQVLDSGVMDRADDWDVEFRFGLERVLDGVGVLVEGRAAPAPAPTGPTQASTASRT
jgi:AcrR family transcriptional regulator